MTLLLAGSALLAARADAALQTGCAAHAAPAHAEAGREHHPEQAAPATTTSEGGEDCSHCPPAECARAASCGSAAGAALVARAAGVTDFQPHRFRLAAFRPHYSSASTSPPTPPPQPAS